MKFVPEYPFSLASIPADTLYTMLEGAKGLEILGITDGSGYFYYTGFVGRHDEILRAVDQAFTEGIELHKKVFDGCYKITDMSILTFYKKED